MAINGVVPGQSYLSQSVYDLKNQLTLLQEQLASGKKSDTYAGMGVNEGFAIAARGQLSNIAAFGDAITGVNTNISLENTALQSMVDLGTNVENAANSASQAVNSSGQPVGQQIASSQLSSMIDLLNTQSGNRYLFSGTAIDTPAVVSMDEMLNGTTTQAGLKQVIAERSQADGVGASGRLNVTPWASLPAGTAVQVAEGAAGSPFGMKLGTVSSTLTGGWNVTGPSGSPPSVSVAVGATNPNVGDNISFNFTMPDGTTETIQLTASSATPPPAGSFAIGANPTATAQNLNTALTNAIGTLANTSLVAASAMAAGNDFFSAGTATGQAVNNQAANPIATTTTLSGLPAGGNTLTSGFQAGDTLTVNGTVITFVASGATGNQLNVTDSVQTLLQKIDSITGTSTPSTVSLGGVITLHTDDAASLSISASSGSGANALAALGFSNPVTAIQQPLRVGSQPLSSATTLVSDSANTVAWYTGNSGPGSARASATARVDPSVTVQYGVQANETGIRNQLQNIAVYAATTITPGSNASGQMAALSQRVAQNLSQQQGQQSIQDIQADLANAQTTMQTVSDRQKQTQVMLQNMVDNTETVSSDQVASEILALQTSLQASYQTTSMLSQLTLVKYLPVG